MGTKVGSTCERRGRCAGGGIGGLIGWAIAKNKGRSTAGFWPGALLGRIAWIIAAPIGPTPEAAAHRIAQTEALLAAIAPQDRPHPAAPVASAVPPGWHPDPRGRCEFRYWDANRWTANVNRGGQQYIDPM
ncbi:MAG: DUF2510 domain-containing protein [Actinomycetota bacterium]